MACGLYAGTDRGERKPDFKEETPMKSLALILATALICMFCFVPRVGVKGAAQETPEEQVQPSGAISGTPTPTGAAQETSEEQVQPLTTAQPAVGELRGPIWISVATTAKPLQSIKVVAPGAGNITVTVTGTVVYEHTQETQGDYCLQLSKTQAMLGDAYPTRDRIQRFAPTSQPTSPRRCPSSGRASNTRLSEPGP
jgi:hypothetical protein